MIWLLSYINTSWISKTDLLFCLKDSANIGPTTTEKKNFYLIFRHYGSIILMELCIVLVPFDWTRALSPVLLLIRSQLLHFLSFHNSINKYGDRRLETMIVSDWKQAWNQFNNQNREKIHIEEL
jgi:hypothetical protein